MLNKKWIEPAHLDIFGKMAQPGEGVLLEQQLRALCLETELEKEKKEKVHVSVSVPLVKGDRVWTGLRGLQGV